MRILCILAEFYIEHSKNICCVIKLIYNDIGEESTSNFARESANKGNDGNFKEKEIRRLFYKYLI